MEQGYSIPVYVVESCPQNKADWDLRSRQLNCSNDDTKINRYHCVPNGKKTALLEFCYDVIRPLVQKDNCMELARSGTLNQHWCKNFLSGCPEKYYYSDESYLYPNCSKINLYGKCYVADPSCALSSTTIASTTETINTTIASTTETISTTIASTTETIFSTGMSFSEKLTCTYMESTLIIVSTILSFLIVLSFLTNIVILYRRKKTEIPNEEELMETETMLPQPSNLPVSDDEEDVVRNVYVGENPNDLHRGYVMTTIQGQERRNEDDLYPKGKEYKKKRIGASIELGTTHSGYCFTDYEKFWNDPVGSIVLHKWNSPPLLTLRTGTDILLDKNLNCIAFGYEAEELYLQSPEKIQKEFYLFSKFIMDLSEYFQKDKIISKHFLRDARKQKEFDAMEIVAKAIEFMMGNIFEDVIKSGCKKEDIKIYWVLTVSSSWNNIGKQFFCDCATKAGISRQELLIVTETDALAMYSSYSEIWKSDTKDVFRCGTKVMVLDVGGTVMNVTIHETDFNGSVKFLRAHESINCGGNNVDIKFKKLLSFISGEQHFGEYEKEFRSDYLEIFRAFEKRKRQAESKEKSVKIKLPLTFVDFCESHYKGKGEFLKQKKGNSIRIGNSITILRDNLYIDRTEFEKLFEDTVKELVNSAEVIYKEESDTELILMVGGFSKSYLLQNCMRDAFSNRCRVLFEDDPEVAVLRGSVMYLHQPQVYQMVEKGVIA